MELGTLFQSAIVLAAMVPMVAVGGASARLTIGGYVPPTQRIVAVQSRATAEGQSVLMLREQNNSALGYRVTIESKTPNGKTSRSPVFVLKCDGQPVHLTANGASLSRAPSRPGRQPTARRIEFSPSPTSNQDVLILTVASQ